MVRETDPPGSEPPPAGGDDEEQQAKLLLWLATRITRTLDLQEVLDESLSAMRALAQFGGGAIQLIEEGMLTAAATDPPMSPEARTVRIPVGQGVSGTIAATGEPVYIADIAEDPRVHPEGRRKGVSAGVRSYFGVPLIAHGEPIGVLQIDAPAVDAFDARTRALVLAFCPTISAAVQNAHLYEQEREATRRLLEAEQLKEDFVSIVSHELRTPLTAMRGFAETLARHHAELTPDRVGQIADRIVDSGGRLQRLIDDLLYASQLERGVVPIDIRRTEVAPVLEAVRRDVDVEQPLVVDVDDDAPAVLVDPDRLHQVVANLVGNAAKFSPPGEPIDVAAREVGDRVELSVQDRGHGVPSEAQTAIFDLFYQVEAAATRTAGGLGIGLYVVKRLCDAMDAEVEVTAPPDGGTRITVALRRADGAASSPPPGPE
jgi:two-component system, OmpR family, sensor histidine kinase KdpD